MEAFGEWIANVGFPIAVAAFLLIRIERVLHNVRDDVKGMNAKVSALGGKVDDLADEHRELRRDLLNVLLQRGPAPFRAAAAGGSGGGRPNPA